MLALLGVAVLVVAIIALRNPKDRTVDAGRHTGSASITPTATATPTRTASRSASSSASTSASTSAHSSRASTTPVVTKLPLVVLNNTTITGLAQRAAERFTAGGWTVTKYDNYQNNILSTCAYYDPSVSGAEAAALALQQQFPTIKRVKPQFAELSAWHSPIVVILTPDYSPD